MPDIFSMEYTELRNAPHFIFNGYHTRDFNVKNVQVDNGLASDTFLADRTPTIEKTRFSEKTYLLGYTEEPLKFKVRLLFDEHKFTLNNIMTLRRMIDTAGFKEFRFDNEEESALNIVVYAMITGASNLTHNVINDGYVDLEFQTNSPRRYSEIMIDEYDFSRSASDRLITEFKSELNSIVQLEETFSHEIKQYTARTNYANIEEFFEDKNKDSIPDGWKIIAGNKSGIVLNKDKSLSLANVKLRKRFYPINNRNYYIRFHGNGGKFRIHENTYNITDGLVHEFKYRRNLLGNSGTFDLDSSSDGIGEGWTQQGDKGTFTINRVSEFQQITDGGILTSPISIQKMQKYVVIADDFNKNSTIKIGRNTVTNTTSLLTKMKFIGSLSDHDITISAATPTDKAMLSHIRVFAVTDDEYAEFDTLTDQQIKDKYPHTDAHDYFELDFLDTAGKINYIDMWELNDVNKKKLDKGTKIEDIIYTPYKKYQAFLNKYKTNFTRMKVELLDNFAKVSEDPTINFRPIRDKTTILLQKFNLLLQSLSFGDDMKKYQWADLQPYYHQVLPIKEETAKLLPDLINFVKLNSNKIDLISNLANSKITVYNFGDKPVYPTFTFESTNGSDILVRNLDTNQQTIISDNLAGETITMIGASEQIYSSRPAPYFKYDAHDDNFIRLGIGSNDLEFAGNFKLKIKYQFVLL
ncbi:hypothetical protein BL313_02195 [Staphylococcus hominis]|uniref:phage tail domain-containing protein n=1 Tax=Staphylococcus hominis TaxID=1290 RepID=UPI0009004635|nr:phage tail domain-containing protein [Staphylococcus hominis]OJH01829.1 hypothetical protein BL313_02195 [Staphylococcus hominis]